MATTTVEIFFAGKTLVIPGYQRDYAWTIDNVNDLFGDVEEAVEANSGHYRRDLPFYPKAEVERPRVCGRWPAAID